MKKLISNDSEIIAFSLPCWKCGETSVDSLQSCSHPTDWWTEVLVCQDCIDESEPSDGSN